MKRRKVQGTFLNLEDVKIWIYWRSVGTCWLFDQIEWFKWTNFIEMKKLGALDEYLKLKCGGITFVTAKTLNKPRQLICENE